MRTYLSLILKLCSLGVVVAAGSFWAGAGVGSRPKYKDEQTFVGGAIWSQILIPMGLIISGIVAEDFDVFVHGYFLFTGLLLLISTGFFLVVDSFLYQIILKTVHLKVLTRSATRPLVLQTYEQYATIIRECLVLTKHRRVVIENVQLNNHLLTTSLKLDKVYFTIGVLFIVAGFLTTADFVLTVI